MKYQDNELFDLFNPFIADVPGFPKEGIIFKDITPILHNADIYHKAIDAFIEIAKELEFDKILAADARGFLFGAPLAYALNKGLVIARKPGKLPRPGVEATYQLEYGSNSLLVSEESIHPGEKILIIDDLLATGGSANAMAELVKKCKATPIACIFFVELCLLKGREKILKENNIDSYSLVKYIDVL